MTKTATPIVKSDAEVVTGSVSPDKDTTSQTGATPEAPERSSSYQDDRELWAEMREMAARFPNGEAARQYKKMLRWD